MLAEPDSWVKVQGISSRSHHGPQSRVGRDYEDHKRGRKMLLSQKQLKKAAENSAKGVEDETTDEAKYWEEGAGAKPNMKRSDSGVATK